MQHPVLLDVASREALAKTDEPLAPSQFRGFRLHTVWTTQAGEDLVRHVAFPHFLGEAHLPMLEYEPERIPQELIQSPKMAVNLRPPSNDHWNIVSDLVLPLIQGTLRQWREAKQVALHQEERSEGAEASPMEVSAPGKSLQVEAEGSREAPPGESVLPKQCVIETMQEILEHIHALCLQNTHEMGSVQELDRTLAHMLMVEFARLQLVIGWDLTKSLIALRINLETSSEAFLLDVAKTLNLHPTDPASHRLKAILQGFQQATSLRVNLPLMELQAAQKDIEGFLQHHLQEISSQTETRELVEGLTRKMSVHASRVRDLVSIPELAEQEVSLRVNTGLAANQPLKANFFSGILEGVAGRLGLVPPGATDPPVSARAGVSCQWAAALREAVQKMEGRDIGVKPVAPDVLPPGLHLDYDPDSETRGVDDIAPVFTPSLLSSLVGNIHGLEKPEVFTQPIPFEVGVGMAAREWIPPKMEAPGLSHKVDVIPPTPVSKGEVSKREPSDKGMSQHDSPMFEVDPEEVVEVIVSDDEDLDLILEVPPTISTPANEPAPHRK